MRSPPSRRRMSPPRSISPGRNNLRLVVKGGGHSYQGTSNAANSLADLDAPDERDRRCTTPSSARAAPGRRSRSRPCRSRPGAIWRHAYDEVTTKGGRYVQGGGCMTVGVAGLILGGGFGSFSKAYGMAAASLIEAEIVTADGEVKIANACSNPDLFWALKGGGGGFGVVTRVTLRTHALPEFFGGVFATIKATSDDAYRRLIAKTRRILRAGAFQSALGRADPHSAGGCRRDFDGLPGPRSASRRRRSWSPFFDWVAASPQDFAIVSAPEILPCRRGVSGTRRCSRRVPGVVIADDRPGAPADNIFWAGNLGEAGARLVRLPVRLAAGFAPRSRPARKPRRCVVCGGEASGRGAALQQGACGRAGGCDRRGEGYADKSSGHRRFRAGHQRRLRTARLSRRSRT